MTGQASTESNYYSRTDLIDLTQQTIEFKAKVNSSPQQGVVTSTPLAYTINDGAVDRGISLALYDGKVSLNWTDASTNIHGADIQLDTHNYHIYRITSTGGGGADSDVTVTLYIDGVAVFTGTNDNTDTTANNQLFGDPSTTAGATSDSDWEYVKIYDAGAEAPVTANTQGELDSVGVINTVISATTLAALQNSKVKDVFNNVPSYGITLPPPMVTARNVAFGTASTSFIDYQNDVYYVAGDGITEFEFSFGTTANTSTQGESVAVTVDVDNDITGTSAAIVAGQATGESDPASTFFSLFTQRNIVLTAGLHEVRPNTVTSGGTSAFLEVDTVWHCNVRKERKLG
jgi:hypothetical protein